ncbi:MAG: FIG00502883: hypothetical protein [uncultured Thermomicrobiales bacterium]|uniref:Uncharacterized protein n=1 Tax=uncultured Thermomicrobiales bacterium TaxID=1645740 RepID=A0A6J4VLL1_9BACT|nr:MAG: FIG00502883: hypothetical protein [uncultured Thermomicrobiales bacterium]
MVTQEVRVEVRFAGTSDEQALAERLLGLLRARGRFQSAGTPIRVSLSSIGEFLTSQGDAAAAAALGAAVAANPAVFAVEERNGEQLVVTTTAGRAPNHRETVSGHDFAQRFMSPQPKPERPALPVRERARVDPSWATLPAVLGDLDFEDEEPEVDLDVDGALADRPVDLPVEVVAGPAVEAPTVAVETPESAPAEVEPLAAAAPEAVRAAEPAAVAPSAPVPTAAPPMSAAPPVAVTPPVPVTPPVAARTFTRPAVSYTDVTGVDDLHLAAAIRRRLESDPRIANFGEQWMMEDRVPRFSRGDLRRMKDYLQEQEQPLTDHVLVQDVLGIRPSTPDFETMRFAVNFRLSREHREFEFVGTANQRFWSTTGLPQIGTTRRKPNEIGTDYRYLLEEVTAAGAPAPRSAPSLDHVLTFYEYQHGLLPYDATMRALLPAPLLPNQKSAVLTFESPQSYTTYLVELRFPTPNRGGFILGLDDLFAENLVPGAVISLSRTENDGHYLVEYIAESAESVRLLELDERRALRYVFRPTTYACGVDERLLLTEERFGRLNGEKPVDEKVRRRPEAVVAATFERVGEHREANFTADFDALFAGVNVERPVSETLLRSILEHDDTGAFSRDPDQTDAYTYVPGTTP